MSILLPPGIVQMSNQIHTQQTTKTESEIWKMSHGSTCDGREKEDRI